LAGNQSDKDGATTVKPEEKSRVGNTCQNGVGKKKKRNKEKKKVKVGPV